MTPEQKQQLKQIRERAEKYLTGTVYAEVYHEDVNTLLSLLDSQGAKAAHRNYECMTTIADETLWCPTCAARAEYLRGHADAATAMRSACVEKVKASFGGLTSMHVNLDELVAEVEAVTLDQQQEKQ